MRKDSKTDAMKMLIERRKGGSSIIQYQPLFSNNSNSLYVIWKDCVREYSTKTGEVIRKLAIPAGTTLIALGLNPNDSENLYGCTNQGDFIIWNQDSGLVNKTQVFDWLSEKENVNFIGFHLSKSNKLYFAYEEEINGETEIKFLENKYSLSNDKSLKYLDVSCQNGPHTFSFGGSDYNEFLSCIHKNKLFIMLLSGHTIYTQKSDKQREFVCIEAHKTEMCIATGDNTGRVLIWKDFTSSEAVFTVYHWHTLPVTHISFTAAASNFYSGGSENTLVKWALDREERMYAPRLGSAIKHVVVASDNAFTAVSIDENAILIMNPNMKTIHTIQHFALNAEIDMKRPLQYALRTAGLTIDPHSKSVIMNSRPGYLQFFNMETQDLVHRMDVVSQNLLTQERNTDIINTDVTKVAVSSDGRWLVTIEERDDGETHREIRMKFWRAHWLEMFKLHTSIEYPHRGKIIDVKFLPVNDTLRLVTSAFDKKFKVWSLLNSCFNEVLDGNDGVWSCVGMGTHHDLQAGPLAFSNDGSLLAAVFDYTITLWDPYDVKLQRALTHANCSKSLSHILFGNGNCCHYLITASSDQLFVWDLLSVTLSWTVLLNISCIAPNPRNDQIAVFTNERLLFIFSPSSNEPIYKHELQNINNVISNVFRPYPARRPGRISWQQQSQLLYLSDAHELYALDETIEDDNIDEEVVISSSTLAPHYQSVIAELIAEKQSGEENKPRSIYEQQLKVHQGSHAHMLCNTSSHMLPSLELIVRGLVKEFLFQQAHYVKVDSVEAMEIDEEKQNINPVDDDLLIKQKTKEPRQVIRESMNWVPSFLDLLNI